MSETPTIFQRIAAFVTGRRAWAGALAVIIASVAITALVGSNDSAGQAPNSLPDSAESAQVQRLQSQFPGSDITAAIVVVTRSDGANLTPADLGAISDARTRMLAVDRSLPGGADDTAGGPPVISSPDGKAALATVAVSASVNGAPLSDLVTALRAAADAGLPSELTAQVTGGPAFGADIANSFSGANFTLLAVTALVVAILLIVTYRSPVLWLVPLIVIAVADRIATTVGSGVAQLTGLSFDGSTSGITSVLVFGAGTNYALLLISRYREELRLEADHRLALRRAVAAAGPAIIASNATVVLALLSLVLGLLPNTRSLGALAASGLVVAAVFVIFVLPPALALFGPKLFWPFVPRVGDAEPVDQGLWFRVASAVSHRPRSTAAVAVVVLAACATGIIGTSIGLSQTQQFRVPAEAVDGFDTLAQHFPSGQSDPTLVVTATPAAEVARTAIERTDGVDSVTATGESNTGLTRFAVVLDAEPASARSAEIVAALRSTLADVPDARALVGGSDAKAYDTDTAAARDRLLLIPLVLLVVLAVLLVLLRAVVASLVLVAATVLSALAALGLGTWVSIHVFGFPALDDNVPLFAFLFLVALGVDYTIFLVTRAKEETPGHGTRGGIVRAVGATGAVITSAGVVLAAVFAVLGVLPLITLTQLGIVVGLGILLDTFVVRSVVVPALFSAIGRRIWWPNPLSDITENELDREPAQSRTPTTTN